MYGYSDDTWRRDLAATYAAGTVAAYQRKYREEAEAEEREERVIDSLRRDANHRPRPDRMMPGYCMCGAYLERHAEQAAAIAAQATVTIGGDPWTA